MKNENIICVSLEEMKSHFDMNKTSWSVSVEEIDALQHKYLFRPDAEHDFTHKQLIPYAIVVDENSNVLCYQRAGSENRLRGIWSAGIGGHVNDKDKSDTIFGTLINGLIREFEEEIGIRIDREQIQLVGMINEEETEVGHCHTGVVLKVLLTNTKMTFDSEISNPTWISPDNIDYSKFELWSALAIKLINE